MAYQNNAYMAVAMEGSQEQIRKVGIENGKFTLTITNNFGMQIEIEHKYNKILGLIEFESSELQCLIDCDIIKTRWIEPRQWNCMTPFFINIQENPPPITLNYSNQLITTQFPLYKT